MNEIITVLPGDPRVRKLLGPGRGAGASLRWSSFLIRQPTEDGLLLYNALTLELLHVPADLLPALESPQGELRERLRRDWYLVPEELDQHTTVHELRELLRIVDPPKSWIRKYTVFTTTACNARCAYCFERGWEPRTMSPETADRAADYMLAHSGRHPFRIDWFGGEPLVNRGAMDRICDRLRAGGARFESAMTTNGYLFAPETARADRERWNLIRCQITLDGTEPRYNEIKNYVCPGGSAYRRVIANVHALAAAGVEVMLRLNFDLSNAEDIRALARELGREFGDEPLVAAYAVMLYEDRNDPAGGRSGEERARLHALRDEFFCILEAGGLRRPSRLPQALEWHMCMADSGDMITILPEGQIGLCEQYARDGFIGRIDRPGLDETVMEEYRVLHPEIPACADCPLFPGCLPLLKCPNQICYPERRDAQIVQTRRAMLTEWKQYKQHKSQGL
ncbi:MAG: radical SAM protein [Oscillospiraceae bacterium]|nr:radical SAM protein [Oscillospiraceae bacterium]